MHSKPGLVIFSITCEKAMYAFIDIEPELSVGMQKFAEA